jgi:hypothetical protein
MIVDVDENKVMLASATTNLTGTCAEAQSQGMSEGLQLVGLLTWPAAYNIPAINQMGYRAEAQHDEWPAKEDDFTRWGQNSMVEIQNLTKKTDDNMVPT